MPTSDELLELATRCAEKLEREGSDSEALPSLRSERVVAWWLFLSFVPSSLLLGVTTYLTTDIAAVPLLWVVPLALYLLTFIIAFARRQPRLQRKQEFERRQRGPQCTRCSTQNLSADSQWCVCAAHRDTRSGL